MGIIWKAFQNMHTKSSAQRLLVLWESWWQAFFLKTSKGTCSLQIPLPGSENHHCGGLNRIKALRKFLISKKKILKFKKIETETPKVNVIYIYLLRGVYFFGFNTISFVSWSDWVLLCQESSAVAWQTDLLYCIHPIKGTHSAQHLKKYVCWICD